MLRDWLNMVRQSGPVAVPGYLFDRVRVRRAERAEGFDAYFGTDTATVAYPWNLPSIARARWSEIYPYEATPARLIREIIAPLPLQPRTFAFVDVGSGKGRTLLIASEFPFAKIVGVEISHELHAIAQENIGRYRPPSQQCTAFELHCVNALDYSFGPEPLVLFLFNPFGEDSFRRILANLEASLRATPRAAYVAYINPRFEGLLRESRMLRKAGKGGAWWRPWSRYVVYAASVAPWS